MPETPDFDAIALRILMTVDHVVSNPDSALESVTTAIAEDLRLVWNARGVADIATLGTVLPNLTTVKLGALKIIDAAIRTLDR